jgi:hypothetical protein
VCAPAVAPGCTGAGGHPVLTISVALAWGKHLFPFRTEQLSPTAPMVLGLHGPGRVGRRRLLSPSRLRAARVVKPRPGWSTSACSWTASASRFPSTAPVLREIGRPLPVDWEDGLRSALPRGLRRAAPRRGRHPRGARSDRELPTCVASSSGRARLESSTTVARSGPPSSRTRVFTPAFRVTKRVSPSADAIPARPPSMPTTGSPSAIAAAGIVALAASTSPTARSVMTPVRRGSRRRSGGPGNVNGGIEECMERA